MTVHVYSSAASHEEAAVGWVLHTLDRDDEVTFLVHLESCEACRRTVADVSGATSSIGEAIAQDEPPARLRDALMSAVADEPHPPRRTADVDEGGSVPAEVTSSPGDGDATVVPLRRRSRVRGFALVAAAAVLVAAVGGLVAANRSLTEQRDVQVAASDRVTGMLRDAGRPGAVHATLADPSGAMVGMVVDTGAGPRVLTTGLGDNRADQIYVLWSLADAQPHAVGTFDVSGSAPSVRSVGSTGETGRPQGYAVSLEPGRTAPASPTEIVASGQVGR